MSVTPIRNCPDDEVLQELAAGVSQPELAQQTMKHVAQCNTCGAALRRYIREFSSEGSPENAAILKQLQSSTPGWQRDLVRKISKQPQRFPWMKLQLNMKLVPAAGALALLIFGIVLGPGLLAEFKIQQAQKQAAAGFADRRTTEMRLTSTEYSPYRPFPITLGAESGRGLDEVPAALNDASGAANKNLRAANADPRWLQVLGRALLWESTPSSLEKAEKDFEKARAEGLDSPSLEIDLAVSYFERDNKSDRPNLQRTLDLLNEVLSKPKLNGSDRATALYNLAIAYEKTPAWDLAVSTWEQYLKVEPSGQWSEEARRRLKAAKAKIPGAARAKPTDPAMFVQHASDRDLQDQLEEYQDVAISAWLPDALEKQSPDATKAVHLLAGLLARDHSDPWLEDLLSSLRKEDLPAVTALGVALQTNGGGDHAQAIEQARKAAKMFAQRKNPSAEFRAQIEEVSAIRRTLNGADCLARADPVWSKLAKTKYYWLQARLSLEKAECGNLLGEFAESDSSLKTSRQIAGQYDYPLLLLRDIGIAAGNKHLRGNCDESWRESVDGLRIYWQRAHMSNDRLYQFYSVMLQCALETGSLHAGEAFLRHAIQIRETSADIKRNRNIEGMLHLHLANVLLARRQDQEAERERQKATGLIDRRGLPPQFELTVKLEPAEFQLEHGDARLALATLEPLRKTVTEPSDSFFSLRFNQALGNTHLKLGQLDEAGAAYQNAIKTAEAALDGITDWAERLQWLHATNESYRGLVRVLINQKRNREALERWELYKSRPLLQEQLAGDSRGVTVSRRQEIPKNNAQMPLMPKSETRIIYADFSDGIQIWVARDTEITSQWVSIARQDFENTSREFVQKCAVEDSNVNEVQQLGGRLFSLLLQPVVSELSTSRTLVVELDRRGYNLPMEALRTPDRQYLGEKYSIVYSPGIWMEKTLRAAGRITGQEALLLIDASHSPGAGYLPGLEAQKNSIAQFFPHMRVIDSAKTGWADARSRLASSEVFHYMGHGRPDGSGTSLDYDANQLLRAKDFTPDLLGRSQMVVLAACSGAAGREDGLADTNNLVHAFLAAGVPSVVASHWNVDSASTSQLIISFYQHLTKNETAAQAMYNARVEIIRTKAHPYFWAGFTLSGRAS